MQDDAHGEAAGEVRAVDQAGHAADHADQSQGGLADGAPWGTCCWEQTHTQERPKATEKCEEGCACLNPPPNVTTP